MSDKTIQVKSWGEGQGEFVVINEADFDKDLHELYGEKKLSAKDQKALDAANKALADTKAALTAKGIAFDESESQEQLQAKLDAAQ